MLLALIGAAILWLVLSPTAALLLGRVIRRRDRQTPTQAAGRGRSDPRLRGARHLRGVR